VQEVGGVSRRDLEATLNLGVGMVAVLPEASVGPAVELLAGRGLRAWVCGSVRAAEPDSADGVSLVGEHAVS
jgi:phosphoribosylformylglycinamidine cyclo-ligase